MDKTKLIEANYEPYKNIVIYSLSDPITGEIRYIGQTANIEQRYRSHISGCDGTKEKRKWTVDLKKAGLKPILTVLEVLNFNDRTYTTRENYYIHLALKGGNDLFNIEIKHPYLPSSLELHNNFYHTTKIPFNHDLDNYQFPESEKKRRI